LQQFARFPGFPFFSLEGEESGTNSSLAHDDAGVNTHRTGKLRRCTLREGERVTERHTLTLSLTRNHNVVIRAQSGNEIQHFVFPLSVSELESADKNNVFRVDNERITVIIPRCENAIR
jgi:hypothetical protein